MAVAVSTITHLTEPLRPSNGSADNGARSNGQTSSLISQFVTPEFWRLIEERISNDDKSQLHRQIGRLENALEVNNGSRFEVVISRLPESTINVIRKSADFTTQLRSCMTNQLDSVLASTRGFNRADWEKLRADPQRLKNIGSPLIEIGKIVRAALLYNIDLGEDKNNPTLVVNIGKLLTLCNQGKLAASLIELALRRGYKKIPEVVILSAIALTGKNLKKPRDVVQYGSLALAALENNALNPYAERVAKVYNVVLATLGNPFYTKGHRDFRNFRGEGDIVDISKRMSLAAEVGLAVLQAKVSFNTDLNRGRLNLLVRGILRVVRTLHCAAVVVDKGSYSPLTANSVQVHKIFNIEPNYSQVKNVVPKTAVPAMLDTADLLLSQALAIAEQCLSQNRHNKEQHVIKGSTINSLFKTMAYAKMPLDMHDCASATLLIRDACRNSIVAKKLHSHSISGFISYLIDYYSGQKDMRDTALELTIEILQKNIFPGQYVIDEVTKFAEENQEIAETQLISYQEPGHPAELPEHHAAAIQISHLQDEALHAQEQLAFMKEYRLGFKFYKYIRLHKKHKSLSGGINIPENHKDNVMASFNELAKRYGIALQPQQGTPN